MLIDFRSFNIVWLFILVEILYYLGLIIVIISFGYCFIFLIFVFVIYFKIEIIFIFDECLVVFFVLGIVKKNY